MILLLEDTELSMFCIRRVRLFDDISKRRDEKSRSGVFLTNFGV